MSNQVDNRVVSMEFDNKRFESNVATSLSTLDKLKNSLKLDGATKGLENIDQAAKSVDMSRLNDAVDSVQSRFSTLGVIGTTVLANLTNSAVNAGKRMASALTSALTQGGKNRALNIELARFQLDGLGVAWKDIEGDIDYAVKGTAYGLDAAAKAASQLVASNIKVGDSMKTALRGISGVAAMTNSSYEDISNIFTRVAGNGRLMGSELLSISSRGINAAAAIGKYINKTEAEVREMTSKGQIDFETFAAAMDSAFGEHAKEANKTFTGALSNMKAALSRIGADVYTVGLTNLRDIFNSLRVVFDDTHKSLGPFISALNKIQTVATKALVKFIDLGGLKNILSGFGNIFKGLWSVVKPIKDAFVDIFPPKSVKNVAELVKKFTDLTSKFKLTDSQAVNLKSTFRGLFAVLDIIVTTAKQLATAILKLLGNFKGIGSWILKITGSLGEYLVKLRDSVKGTNILGKTIAALGGVIQNIIGKLKQLKNTIAEKLNIQGLVGFHGLLEAIWILLKNVGSKIVDFGKIIANNMSTDKVQSAMGVAGAILLIRKAWIDYYIGIGAPIKRMISIFKAFFAGVKDVLGLGNSIKSTFEALSSSLWNLNRTIKYQLLMNYAKALLMLAAAVFVLSSVDAGKLAAGLGAVTVLLSEMTAMIAILDKMSSGGTLGGKGIKGWFTGLSDSILQISKISNMTTTMIKISVAILLLAFAMKTLGSLNFEQTIQGLGAIGVLMIILVTAVKSLTGKGDDVVKGAGQILVLSFALTVMAGALKIVASLGWEELGKGLLGIAAVTAILVIAAKRMQSEYTTITKFAGQMLTMSVSLAIMAGVLKSIAAMGWEDLGRGLAGIAGAMAIMIASLAIMSNIEGNMAGSAGSILLMSMAISVLSVAMKRMGSMSWEAIAKGMVVLAGSLAILGVAAYALMTSGATLALLGFAGAIALIGVGVFALGAGLVAAAAGIASLAVALSTGASALVAGLNILILGIINLMPAILVAICDGLKLIIRTLIDIIVTSIPDIAAGIGKLIVGTLEVLVSYTPKIINLIFDFIVSILNGIANRIPDLVQAGVNILMSLFQGVVNALKGVDPKVLIDGLIGVGLLSGLVVALAAIASLIPAAMVGVLGLGVFVAELALVIAALGKLSQIDGLTWLISEGGYLMEAIGTAIGQFIGGIVGGVAKGVSSALPEIGDDLSDFMKNVKPFIEGAKTIDSSTFNGVKSLVGIILALTGANIIERLTSWFTGGSSLEQFGEELASFGPYMKDYADSVSGMDSGAVVASATAAKALSELANGLPNSGGVAGFFAGENDISTFGAQLVPFGVCMKLYSKAISGIDPDAIVNSATAAKTLVELANNLPNSGGIAAFFSGENDLSSFGDQLVPFGLGMRAFSKAITAEGGINSEAVTAAANAGKTLAELANTLPNTGGLVSVFTGDNSLVGFSGQLVLFGLGMRAFSKALTEDGGIDSEAVTAAANAGKTLSELAAALPNTGGLVSLFTGDNSLDGLGDQLVLFGLGIKAFSDTISADGGINSEAVSAAANAGKILSELSATLPKTGGLAGVFAGEQNLANLGDNLEPFGKGIKKFSDAISADGGIDVDAIAAISPAVKALTEVASTLNENEGLLDTIFGDTSIGDFGDNLEPLGKGIKKYSDAVSDGETPINSEIITASANAVKTLAEMAAIVPKNTGHIVPFAENLVGFSEDIKSYFSTVSEVEDETVTKSTNISNMLKSLSEVTDNKGKSMKSFGKNLVDFAKELSDFDKKMSKIKSDNVKSAITKITDLTKLGGEITNDKITALKSFASALNTLGEEGILKFVNALKSDKAKSDAKKALIELIDTVIDTTKTLNTKNKFASLGKYCMEGLAKGISDNKSLATNAAQKVADAVETIIRAAWRVNSPSKVFYGIALGVPEGIGNAFKDGIISVKRSARTLADTATNGFNNTVQKIAEFISSDIDAQPTIRPVLDLSNVQAGASAIGGMFGNRTLSISAPGIGAISASMANRQNGNNTSDIVSGIKALRKDIASMPRESITINGVTYDDGSNITGAVKAIVRQAKIERRN